MKQVHSVAPGRHLLALVGLAFAASVGSLSAADHYYVNDHLATTTAVTDAAGEIAAIEADAFGTPVAGAVQAARFTGKPYDDDIGAFVFPFRNYRSDEARWMSADPSGFPDGVNASYYAPNPLKGLDPTGLAYAASGLTATELSQLSGALNTWLVVANTVAYPVVAWQGRQMTLDFLTRYKYQSGDQTVSYDKVSSEASLTALNNKATSAAHSGSNNFNGDGITSSQWNSADLRTSFGGVYVKYSYTDLGGASTKVTGTIDDPYDFHSGANINIPYLSAHGATFGWNGGDFVSDTWMSQLAGAGYAKVFNSKVSWSFTVSRE